MLETADIPKDDECGEQRDRGGDEVWIQGRVTRNESDSDSGHKKQRETSSTGREWVQAGPYRRYASDKSEIEKEVTLPARHDDLRCLAWSRPRAPGVAAARISRDVRRDRRRHSNGCIRRIIYRCRRGWIRSHLWRPAVRRPVRPPGIVAHSIFPPGLNVAREDTPGDASKKAGSATGVECKEHLETPCRGAPSARTKPVTRESTAGVNQDRLSDESGAGGELLLGVAATPCRH